MLQPKFFVLNLEGVITRYKILQLSVDQKRYVTWW